MIEVPKITQGRQHPILKSDNPYQHFTLTSQGYIGTSSPPSLKPTYPSPDEEKIQPITPSSPESDLPSFTLNEEEGAYWIKELQSGEEIYITTVSPDTPKITRVEKKGNLFVIYYFAGAAGTSSLITFMNAVVFDTRSKIFLEQIYTTELKGDLRKESQPSFSVENDKVDYTPPPP